MATIYNVELWNTMHVFQIVTWSKDVCKKLVATGKWAYIGELILKPAIVQ